MGTTTAAAAASDTDSSNHQLNQRIVEVHYDITAPFAAAVSIGAGLPPFMPAVLPFKEMLLLCMAAMLTFLSFAGAVLPMLAALRTSMLTAMPFMEARLIYMLAVLPETEKCGQIWLQC